MQIKVENVETRRRGGGKRPLNSYVYYITKGKLVLVESHSKTLSVFDNSTKSFVKPIIISETEKIEVGDLYYWNGLIIKDHEVPTTESTMRSKDFHKGAFKILALPEHFSPEQLQMIVDGKLKDGEKVLVECKIHDKWLKENPPFDNNKGKEYYQIKLNPHIALHKVEESIIDKLKSIKPDYDKAESYQHGFHDAVEVMIKWFEQNVK